LLHGAVKKFTMRRGRTVQIKMSSATAWTGSMITPQFVSLTANCSKLVWQYLQRSCLRNSWRFDGQSASSCQPNSVVLRERRWPADNHLPVSPGYDRTRTDRQASLSWRQHTAGPVTSEADEALVKYGRIS